MGEAVSYERGTPVGPIWTPDGFYRRVNCPVLFLPLLGK